MKAGYEFDRLVAKAMGWDLTPCEFGHQLPGGPLKALGITDDGFYITELPRFSTNMTAAWDIVKMMDRKGYSCVIATFKDGVQAHFWPRPNETEPALPKATTVMAETGSLAICLAALKALGIDVGEKQGESE